MTQQLLERLQNKISDVSVNSLRRVYPSELQEWLDLSDIDGATFIRDLVENNMCYIKYDFSCECGNNCTAYVHINQEFSYICTECERHYDYKTVTSVGTQVLELKKQEIMTTREKTHGLSVITDVNKDIDHNDGAGEKMKKKKVFIGSSTNVKDKVKEVARWIDDLGGEAIPWFKPGVFPPAQYTFDILIEKAKNVDGAIFMFNGEDEEWYDNGMENVHAVRDNVLLEYGLFSGILGRKNVAFICSNKPKIASDLAGITYMDGNKSEYQLSPELSTWLENIEIT